MSQLDDLQNYVGFELPRRSVHLTYSNTGYDGDPNDGGAPGIVQNAPLGTWFREQTAEKWWRKAETEWVYDSTIEVSSRTWYVDPAGDDNGPGTQSNPLATIYEASRRASGYDVIYLSADPHVLTDHGFFAYERNLISGLNIQVKGARPVEETFTVQSWSNNVVTAQGSPGWTTDEHANKQIRWYPYGVIEDFYFGFVILSNTANTLTVAASVSGLGGTTTVPGAGVVVDIVSLGSSIVHPASSYYPAQLYVSGGVTFWDIFFDGTVNAGQIGLNLWDRGAFCTLRWCKFEGYDYAGLSASGQVSVGNTLFKDCAVGLLSGDYSVLNPDNVFRGGTVGIQLTGGVTYLNHGCLGWYVDCSSCISIDTGVSCDDGTISNWVQGTVDTYVRVEGGGLYRKTSHAIKGVTGQNTFTGPVVFLEGSGCFADCFNSNQSTVLPDAGYFKAGTDLVSLTDHIANGSDTEFAFGNRIVK